MYVLYAQKYPEDVELMENRKRVKPGSHSLEGYLNGELYIYSNKIDRHDPDKPAIQMLAEMTYRFI